MKKIFISALALAFTLSLTAQSYTPAVKLVTGKKYEIVTTIDGATSAEVMGQTMETPIKSTSNATLDVKTVLEKGYQASYITNRMQFNASMMGQEMNYDSDKKEDKDGQLGKGLNKLVGAETSFIVDAQGNIVKESVVKPKEEKAEEGGDMMAGMMSNMGVANSGACPAFNLFTSTKEIKIGDSFTDSSTTSDKDGKVMVSTIYTLKEIKDGLAMFAITGTSKIDKKIEQMGMEMASSTTSKSTGQMTVDIATGLLSKKSMVIETTGTVDAGGMTIPMTGKTTTSLTVTAK